MMKKKSAKILHLNVRRAIVQMPNVEKKKKKKLAKKIFSLNNERLRMCTYSIHPPPHNFFFVATRLSVNYPPDSIHEVDVLSLAFYLEAARNADFFFEW